MNITIDKNSNFERKGGGKININARYRLEPTFVPSRSSAPPFNYDVIDKARELQFLDGVIFSNGTEKECREWVLRNCEEPVEHTKGPWMIKGVNICDLPRVADADGKAICVVSCRDKTLKSDFGAETKANADVLAKSTELLALLEQYHQSFPSKESGKLICEARGWLIQE